MNAQVTVAIIQKEDKYLLIQSKKNFGVYTGYLYPPGGHVEFEETSQQAIRRELQEELGIKVSVQKLLAQTINDKQQHTDWYMCTIENHHDIAPNDVEIANTYWLTKQQILNQDNIFPATKQIFKEYL